jgi:hypothetical protein
MPGASVSKVHRALWCREVSCRAPQCREIKVLIPGMVSVRKGARSGIWCRLV